LTPALSVVLGAPCGYAAVRRTVQRLKRQTRASSIEVIVVGFGTSLDVPPEDARPFHSFRTIQLDTTISAAIANAVGVRSATAPIVAFAEDHCFPEPGWAEAMLDAHSRDHSVVGPALRNANPASSVSWTDFLMGYGP
jgi:hypothetical protein